MYKLGERGVKQAHGIHSHWVSYCDPVPFHPPTLPNLGSTSLPPHTHASTELIQHCYFLHLFMKAPIE